VSLISSCYLTLIHLLKIMTRYVISNDGQSFSVDAEGVQTPLRGVVCEREGSL